MKKLTLLTFLTAAFILTFAANAFYNGKVMLLVSIEVKDYEAWKKNFDAGAPAREKSGIKVISICASPENPKMITVIEEAENAQAAHDFILKLKSIRQQHGDTSALTVKMLDKLD